MTTKAKPARKEEDPNARCRTCNHRFWQHNDDGECERICGTDDPYCDPYRCDCTGWQGD